MHQRGCGIIAEAQGDEAGMPFGVDARDRTLGTMSGCDLVSLRGIAGVEQLARDQAALRPPFVAIAEQIGVARNLSQRLGGLDRLVRSSRLLRLQEGKRDVALQ